MLEDLPLEAPRGFRRYVSRQIFNCAVLALLLGACSSGGASDLPFVRSLGWFGYLDGADIRRSCAAGGGDRYRFVYNAVWGEQVRDYEIFAGAGPAPPQLAARILFPEAPGQIDLRDPLSTFRGRRAVVPLAPSDLEALRRALEASGFQDAAPAGIVLPSDGYYWIIAACVGGAYHFNAYLYPSRRFAEISFPAWLFAHDPSGVPVRPPAPTAPRGPENRVTIDNRSYSIFDLVVGGNGLAGLPHLF
ncbi:MAG: hypothetical protein JO010_04990 [Alphaproteobacteria bacterium]|nr:hypothetical protein [Alphaproteobacteria bacterium]